MTVPLFSDFAVLLRFVVTAPLLVVGLARLDAMTALALRHIVRSQLVDEAGRATLEAAAHGSLGAPKSWLPWGGLAAIVVVNVAFLRIDVVPPSSSWQFLPVDGTSIRSWAGWWYLIAGLPAFQFVIFGWLWRYLQWCRLLWRISRLDLNLAAAHPDRAGGLGYLGGLHRRLWIVLFALEAFPAGLIGQEISHLGTRLAAYEVLIISLVALGASVMLAPLIVFTRKLAQTRSAGVLQYGALAMEYVRAFERKWLLSRMDGDEALIGSADIQSLADMGNSFQLTAGMRIMPCDLRSLSLLLISAAAAPYLPLLLFVLPLREIVKIVFGIFF